MDDLFFSASVLEKFQASKSSRLPNKIGVLRFWFQQKTKPLGAFLEANLIKNPYIFSEDPRGTYMSVVDLDGKPGKLYTFYRGWNTTQLYRD